MTFTPTVSNKVSSLNSTTAILTGSSEYLGTAEDVEKYLNVMVTVKSDVSSASTGLKFEFSSDNSNWDVVDATRFDSSDPFEVKIFKVKSKWFRVRYTNGVTGQSTFRLQTRYEIAESKRVSDEQKSITMVDSFNRIRVSEPYTLLSHNHVLGKNLFKIYEGIAGSATSVFNTNASQILMSTTGTGSVIRRSRYRAIYQPGKSLLIYMSGVLNAGSNASTVTTKIGYYDDASGYYFQYVNGVVSVVERSSVTGSLSEIITPQSSWNINTMLGTTNKNKTIDPGKTIIYWFNISWLGVGSVDCGIIIDHVTYPVHRFRHSNALTTPYIKTASLHPTYQIISTGGAGSMTAICYTVLSEGSDNPIGDSYSINMGTTSRATSGTVPLMTLRLKTGAISTAILNAISIIATANANFLTHVWRFVDVAASTVLNETTFISTNDDSSVEYNIAATTVTTTGGLLIYSAYTSNSTNTVNIDNKNKTAYLSMNAGVSDLIVVAVTTVGNANEDYLCAIDWSEFI